MPQLSCEHHLFAFSKEKSPVLTVKSGDVVEIQTMDCFANQLQTAGSTLSGINWDQVNPATGPIFVEGAKPGNVLKASILNIDIGPQGIMATGEGFGVLGHKMKGMYEKILPIKDGYAVFNDKIRLPLNKMIGVIGVAPAGEPVNCGTPGSHGGNMDNKLISENTAIYFPVAAEGALFALGDVHAVMGDGEIGVSGVEIPAVVRVKLEVIENMSLRNPFLETENAVAFIASHENLEQAMQTAVEDMETYLSKTLSLETPETAMLLSAAGNLEICQVVDPLKTVRFVVPKWLLKTQR